MRNDDPMYVRHLEQALESAEKEIKGLEDELREKDRLLCEMQEQLMPPTFMGEPFIRAEACHCAAAIRARSNAGVTGSGAQD